MIKPESAAENPLPAGATDTHVHVFDPARHPYGAARSYTPAPATVADLRRQLTGSGAQRVVLVQPSVYGVDNACLLDALAQLGPDSSRGIAVVDTEHTPRETLLALHDAGVRGIRLNFEVRHERDTSHALRQLARAAQVVDLPGWCVQVHCAGTLLGAVQDVLADFPVPVVLDHFAGVSVQDGARALTRAPADAVLRLLDTRRVYVKLSAFYRASSAAPAHNDLAPLAQRWLDAHPDRVLWGSDWPHTGGGAGSTTPRDPTRIEPFRRVDVAASLKSLRSWCRSAAVFRQVLVDNPAALYGFKLGTPRRLPAPPPHHPFARTS